MPATLVHCAAADLLKDHADLPAEMKEALTAEPEAGRLGALLPDLPFFGGFYREVVRHILRRPPADPEWGQILHHRPPFLLGESLVERLRASEEKAGPGAGPLGRRGLALVAGFHSHVALDLTHHRLVNELTRKILAREGGASAVIHRRIEKFHSLFLLEELTGAEVIGTAAARERLSVTKNGARLDRPMAKFLELSFQGAFGRAPSVRTLRDWTMGIARYGALVSGPLGRWERRRTEKDRRVHVEAMGAPIRPLLDHALDLTTLYCRAALDLYQRPNGSKEDRAAYIAAVPEDNLSYPEDDYLPPFLLEVPSDE